jgi:small conductance mechanosensitive channel
MEGFEVTLDWANRDIVSILLGLLAGILTLIVGRWLARLLTRYTSRSMERAHVDSMVIRFAKNLVYIGVMTAVIIAAMNAVGIHTTSLTALLASAGVAIGLALKDALSNLASGVMILLFRPYTLNQNIDGSGTSGSVEEVGLFSTILRTPDNVMVIVPNSSMIKGNIKNYSAFGKRRVDLVARLNTDDIGSARDQLLEAVSSHPLVLPEPAASVEVIEIGESDVSLSVRPWVRSEDYDRGRSGLLEMIKNRIPSASVS